MREASAVLAKLSRYSPGAIAIVAFTTACSAPTDAAAPPPAPVPVSGQLAFPGAIGHGAASKGGRGGRIFQVTTLGDTGPGSLRACIDESGPRTCVFRVSGIIRFVGRPPILTNPFITIAGHTAPGGGITLAHSGGEDGRTPLIIKNTHDVVVRHIRVRLDRAGGSRGSEDGFTIENSDNVVLDHVSASWARDELYNGYADNDRITVSNSIFAEGIPPHDKCALLGSDPTDAQRVSFIGNLCAHNGDRNPDINFPPGSCVEVTNNVLYNAQSQFAEVWESFGGSPVSIVGNFFKSGSNTSANTVGIARNLLTSTGTAQVYLWDNRFDGNFQHISPLINAVAVASPPCPPTVQNKSPTAAYDAVLGGAGAFPRDSFDSRIVADVRNRSGRIVQAPGTIPRPAAGSAYPDADRDGMDDGWEARNGAVRGRSDPWDDGDGDGIPNLDEFLAERHSQLMAGSGGI
jgi:pectate lyase